MSTLIGFIIYKNLLHSFPSTRKTVVTLYDLRLQSTAELRQTKQIRQTDKGCTTQEHVEKTGKTDCNQFQECKYCIITHCEWNETTALRRYREDEKKNYDGKGTGVNTEKSHKMQFPLSSSNTFFYTNDLKDIRLQASVHYYTPHGTFGLTVPGSDFLGYISSK